MKKNKLIVGALFIVGMTLFSCTKEEALTPNESFTGNGVDINIDGTGGSGTGGTGGSGGGPTTDLVVEKRQRALVTYVGATWCPPCGAYGDPTKEHMETTHGNDVVILNVQSGDKISLSTAFGPRFGGVFQSSASVSSIPHAYWSGANFTLTHRGFSNSASSNNASADNDVNAIKGDNPDVGIAAKASIVGDSVKIETLTKFYKLAASSFIGVYLLEDGVDELQEISGSVPTVTSHENVLRGAAYTGNTLGVESLGTSFVEDQEVIGNYTMAIPSTVLDRTKMQIAVVMWETNQYDGISNAILVDVQ